MKKVNLVEILKDCPKGTQLYSPLCGECKFEKIYLNTSIVVYAQDYRIMTFNVYGQYHEGFDNAECLLFPSKKNRDWSKFKIPFRDGDVIANNAYIAIFHKLDMIPNGVRNDVVYYHCWRRKKNDDSKFKIDFGIGYDSDFRFATDEEKQILFDAIKTNGYKWVEETKTLEKLIIPKFKVGDVIKAENRFCEYKIKEITNTHYTLESIPGGCIYIELISEDKNWELISDKFNLASLKPYDKVLVRDDNNSAWINAFFGFYDTVTTERYPFVASGVKWEQCIPYEGNEHLLGTTNDCNEFYKNW